MKNKFVAATLLIAMIFTITSCATSRSNRKYGCPMAQVTEKSPNT